MPAAPTPLRLRTLLGDHPATLALKRGEVFSAQVTLDIADIPRAYVAFKRVVRDLEFDVAEIAIATHLMAKAHGKPYVLLPVVVMSRFQHPFLVYDSVRGELRPSDLPGRRVGIRSYSVTTTMWLRGVLAEDYDVDIDAVRWVTFEEAHVAEFRDPPSVERAPANRDLLSMLLSGEVDAAILGDIELPDPRLKRLIPDAERAARDWHARHGVIQINHMVAFRESLARGNPDAVREVYRMLCESRRRAPAPPTGGPDPWPIGVEANRRNLEVAIDFAYRQRLIPRRYAVDELFDEAVLTGVTADAGIEEPAVGARCGSFSVERR